MTVKSLIRKWQIRLSIQDWVITYEFCTNGEMDGEYRDTHEVLGRCLRDPDDCTAHIQLRHRLGTQLESVILHEMLHILDLETEEVRINKTARALLMT